MRWESFVATQMGKELQREIRLNAHSIAAPVYVSYFLPVLVNKVGAEYLRHVNGLPKRNILVSIVVTFVVVSTHCLKQIK